MEVNTIPGRRNGSILQRHILKQILIAWRKITFTPRLGDYSIHKYKLRRENYLVHFLTWLATIPKQLIRLVELAYAYMQPRSETTG